LSYFHFLRYRMKIIDYEEKKKRGAEGFPIEYHFITSSHYRYVMQLHWHREFEIIRVLAGELRVFLNNTEYVAKTGDIIFVCSHMLHRAEPIDCVYECIVFDLNLIRGDLSGKVSEYLVPLMAGDSEIDAYLQPERSPLYVATQKLFETMCDAGIYYELSVCSILAEIFYHLFADGKVSQCVSVYGGHRRKSIATLIEWIEKNYPDKITLSEMSERSGFNEKYLCRVFREFTGETPTEYINRRRVERAAFEMAVNRKNVTEAAYESGFNELSHFSRTFKKYKGISPREFCRELSKGDNANAKKHPTNSVPATSQGTL